jgi:acetyl-CoA synthetase
MLLQNNSIAEIMDSEDPLFIYFWLYGKPKGMVHTAGYMVQTAYTFKMFFNYEENDVSGAPLI